MNTTEMKTRIKDLHHLLKVLALLLQGLTALLEVDVRNQFVKELEDANS